MVRGAAQNLLQAVALLVLTFTFDNGSACADHRQFAQALAAKIFFARVWRSCGRGLNQHTNGLLRACLPKSETLRELAPQRLAEAADRLNHRPRRVLDYRTSQGFSKFGLARRGGGKGAAGRGGQSCAACAITPRVALDPIPLRAVRVRTVRPEEEARWNALMRAQHYLGFRQLCGQRLRQVAVLGEHWLALLGWQLAAWHCAARERWIGWTQRQRQQRLFLLANQSRFLLLPPAGSCPHLASRVLGLSLRQLPQAWQRQHAAPLLLAETFVDPRRFAGTCYRAANWLASGQTQAYGRVRGAPRG